MNAALDIDDLESEALAGLASRALLTARLADLVTWPATRIPQNERQLAADVLMGLLRTASLPVRAKLAEGLARVEDAPKPLLRYLARDEISVARPLLEEGVGFDDSDLLATIRYGMTPHWRALARRKGLSAAVTEALLQTGDAEVIASVLGNPSAALSQPGVDFALEGSRTTPSLVDALLTRAELRPTQALVLFWWSDFAQRIQILRRYAAERQTLIAELGDVFAAAARERWQDPESRKALQVIERRQRNRAALERSVFASFEDAIDIAAARGMNPELAAELGYLCGVKPATIKRIFADPGGEAIGVLAKATGLRKPALAKLWRALGRLAGDPATQETPFGRLMYVYDILSSAKAQTALRYWNWSLSADSGGINAFTLDEGGETLAFSPARRNAALLAVARPGELAAPAVASVLVAEPLGGGPAKV